MEPIYDTVVAKISDFLLEELQHERFGDARTQILESAARVSVCTGSKHPSINFFFFSFSPQFSQRPVGNPMRRQKKLYFL